MPPLNVYPDLAGFIGVGVESVKNTPVAATEYLPLLQDSLAADPGIILPEVFGGSRDPIHTPVIGEQKLEGKIDVPLYPDRGMQLLSLAFGTDTYQYSSAVSTGQAIGGAGVNIGVSSVVIATQTSPAIVANDYIELHQLGVGQAVGTNNLSEIHKVASITPGTSGPFTISISSETTVRAYLSTGSVYRIPSATAVFSHVIMGDQPTVGTYKTLTVEKNGGGLDSRQYAGAVVKKAALALTTKDYAKMSYDLSAVTDINVTPTTPTYGTSAPFALANFALSLFGSPDTSIVSFNLDVDNGAKEYWTFGQNMPAIIPPLKRLLKGKWSNIVQTRTYYSNMLAGTEGAALLTLTQGTNIITVNLPKFVITKIGQPLKVGELFMFDVDFAAHFDDSNSFDAKVTVTNSAYLPFA